MCMWARTGSVRQRVQLNLGNGARSTRHSDSNGAKYRLPAPWNPVLGLLKRGIFQNPTLKNAPAFKSGSTWLLKQLLSDNKYSIQKKLKLKSRWQKRELQIEFYFTINGNLGFRRICICRELNDAVGRNGCNECSDWVSALLCCERDPACRAESAIANMLYWLGAALNKQCSKSRCMSHQQSPSAAEDMVSRFLCEAFSTRNI